MSRIRAGPRARATQTMPSIRATRITATVPSIRATRITAPIAMVVGTPILGAALLLVNRMSAIRTVNVMPTIGTVTTPSRLALDACERRTLTT